MPKAGSAVGPRPIAHVIFDVDGTLVDNLDLIARSYNYAIKEFVHREFSRDEVYAKFGPPMKQMVTQTVPAEHAAAAIQRYQDHYRENFHQYA